MSHRIHSDIFRIGLRPERSHLRNQCYFYIQMGTQPLFHSDIFRIGLRPERSHLRNQCYFYIQMGTRPLFNLYFGADFFCLFLHLDLNYLCVGRTAPYHWWCNPVQQIMSILNMGLQCI